jgi:hypothetical protein
LGIIIKFKVFLGERRGSPELWMDPVATTNDGVNGLEGNSIPEEDLVVLYIRGVPMMVK